MGSERLLRARPRDALRRRRAAPFAGGRAVRPRGDPAVGPHALHARHRRGAQGGGLLPRAPRDDLRVDSRALRRQRADRRADGHRAPALAGGARRGRRPGGRRRAGRSGARRGQRAPLRADRARARAHAAPARHDLRDPGPGPQQRGAPAPDRRGRREGDVRGRPRRAHQGLPQRRRRPPRGDRQVAAPGRRRPGPDRHAVGVRRPRRDHRRLPAGEPDRPGGATLDGQVGAGHQHRRERRAPQARAAARRAVQPRDVRGRARPALHRQPGLDQGRRPAQGAAQGGAQVEARPRRRRALQPRPAVHRRLLRHRDPRDPRQGPAPARPGGAPRRPRADHRRLPPADAARRARREPRRAGRPDEPRAEDPRARAPGPGHRPVAAFARRRVAHRQAAAAVGPARVGPDRAGRRPRHVHLPRRVLQREHRPARRGGPDHRQAPQRRPRATCR